MPKRVEKCIASINTIASFHMMYSFMKIFFPFLHNQRALNIDSLDKGEHEILTENFILRNDENTRGVCNELPYAPHIITFPMKEDNQVNILSMRLMRVT